MSVDVLAIGAHPDDVELGVGGTLLLMADQEYSVCILDLTQGEAGSRGTVKERMKEADKAAGLLDVEDRYNAELPDGGLANTTEQQRKLIPFIRALRPTVILCHRGNDRHPDHRVACDLVRDANFFAGLASIETDEGPYRAPYLYHYNPYFDDDAQPDIVMDVSEVFDDKLEALKAYKSQLFNAGYEGPETLVSSSEFWDAIRTRASYWGDRVGVDYGEPLYSDGPLALMTLPGLEPEE